MTRNTLGLWFQSMRHTRKRQLLRRLGLLLKRRLLRPWYASLSTWRRSPGPSPQLAAMPPGTVFEARQGLVERDQNGVFLIMLGRRDRLLIPFDWLPRHLAKGTYLERLNFHYMEFLEALTDPEFSLAVEDWIARNPPYQSGYWLDSWNSYALSIRCVVWMQQYARRQGSLPAELRESMLRSIREQLRFLEANLELDIGGNHLIKNLKALLWGGGFFQGGEAKAWRERAVRVLRREIEEQILADGMHYERSAAYHAQVFADLLECLSVLGLDPARQDLGWLEDALDRMAAVLADLTHPDGLVSLFNDAGLHMTYPPEELLRAYQRVRRRPAPAARTIVELRQAGYFGTRSGGGLLLVDCGPIGPEYLPAHGHGDILAFEWSVGERRIVVDAGVYEYHPGELRRESRATACHNTVTVDGLDQCEFWKAFRVGRRGRGRILTFAANENGMHFSGWHDGYLGMPGKPRHERSVVGDAEVFTVEDRVLGGRSQTVAASLLFHPDCRLELRHDTLIATAGAVVIELTSRAKATIETAEWFPDFGVRQATYRLRLEYGRAPCAGGFQVRVIRR